MPFPGIPSRYRQVPSWRGIFKDCHLPARLKLSLPPGTTDSPRLSTKQRLTALCPAIQTAFYLRHVPTAIAVFVRRLSTREETPPNQKGLFSLPDRQTTAVIPFLSFPLSLRRGLLFAISSSIRTTPPHGLQGKMYCNFLGRALGGVILLQTKILQSRTCTTMS